MVKMLFFFFFHIFYSSNNGKKMYHGCLPHKYEAAQLFSTLISNNDQQISMKTEVMMLKIQL